jgi:transposase-like protein
MRRCPEERRQAVVAKLLPPQNMTSQEVAEQEGISLPTLYKWRAEARAAGCACPIPIPEAPGNGPRRAALRRCLRRRDRRRKDRRILPPVESLSRAARGMARGVRARRLRRCGLRSYGRCAKARSAQLPGSSSCTRPAGRQVGGRRRLQVVDPGMLPFRDDVRRRFRPLL